MYTTVCFLNLLAPYGASCAVWSGVDGRAETAPMVRETLLGDTSLDLLEGSEPLPPGAVSYQFSRPVL